VSRLRVLGSGDAFNAGGALHSAYLLEGPAKSILLECGPSILAGLKRAKIDTLSIDSVLISHLHGDHFGGIAYLFMEYAFVQRRKTPLKLFGPPGLEERVVRVHTALYSEKIFRKLNFEIEYGEVRPGDTFRLADNEVEAFEVPHSAEPFSLGYRVTTPDDQRVLFSGDSAWTDEFIEKSRDVDLFLCECCTLKPETPVHISYAELLAKRDQLGCKKLLLTHLGACMREASDLSCDLAVDGMVVDLG
jgi:ribonuclease BN (tRNA processing enzyme)